MRYVKMIMYVRWKDVSEEDDRIHSSGVLESGIEENANFVRRVARNID
jgi:hypothetical protein